jgi:hypothetical protein
MGEFIIQLKNSRGRDTEKLHQDSARARRLCGQGPNLYKLHVYEGPHLPRMDATPCVGQKPLITVTCFEPRCDFRTFPTQCARQYCPTVKRSTQEVEPSW